MEYLKAVEALLQDAVAAGHFSGLPGEGRPLSFKPEEGLAGDDWLGFKVLQNAELLPEWLNIGRDIERQQCELKEIDARHQSIVEKAKSIEDWAVAWPVLLQLREKYAERAYELRRTQERRNWEAPGHLSQRAPIWVEYHLERLDSRLASPVEARPRTR